MSCLRFPLLLSWSRFPRGLMSQRGVIMRILILRDPWSCSWWPQGVTVGSHQEFQGGWLAADLRNLKSQWREPFPWPAFRCGCTLLASLRLTSQGSLPWGQAHLPPDKGCSSRSSHQACVHTPQHLHCLFPFPRVRKPLLFTKTVFFPFS